MAAKHPENLMNSMHAIYVTSLTGQPCISEAADLPLAQVPARETETRIVYASKFFATLNAQAPVVLRHGFDYSQQAAWPSQVPCALLARLCHCSAP